MMSEGWLGAFALVQRYAWMLDAGESASLGDLFTQDAVFDSLPSRERSEHFPFPAEGREAIVAALVARQAHWDSLFQRIHAIANFAVRDYLADTVHTSTQLLEIHTARNRPGESKIALTGQYDDTIVLGGDGFWRFSRRSLVRHNDLSRELAGY